MNKKKSLIASSSLVVFALIAIDQLVKYWTITHFKTEGESMPFIPGILNLTYLRNAGAAWGMLQGQVALFYAITFVAVTGILYMIYKELQAVSPSTLVVLAYSFVLAGAVGNFIDRLHLQYVIDMFELVFIQFPIFNVADASLTIGVVLLFVYIFFFERKDVQREK